MGKILEHAEALWKEEKNTLSYHPYGIPRGIELINEFNSQRTWFYKGFSNSIIRETNDGLIIVDPGAIFDVIGKFRAVRQVTLQKVHTAIYTHGHVDHIGIQPYIKENKRNNWPDMQIIAHEAIINRLDRYKLTEGWNGYINLRQFRGGKGGPIFPTNFYYPTLTYKDALTIEIGDVKVQLKHNRGETDDHTWVYFPDTEMLCTGDLFMWSVPNAGNPQKVQRYANEWAVSLREMEKLNPKILCPGHGVPIIGKERIKEGLINTALLLESLHTHTLELMNKGVSLDEILHTVKTPDELLKKPYLKPVYDEPEFIVRNIWRLYGGWYDGTPSHLKPASEAALALEIANLVGGGDKLAERALELANRGDLRLACHLAEWAWLSSPDNKKISDIASKVFTLRARNETSTMAIGIYTSTVRKMGGELDKELSEGTIIKNQDQRGQND
ncbi:MAG: alkyl sulfatase dimerization domain-containing protein [Promethearchaeota archaeon]|jgi:alkyl sulfatase BDS1-like metallo-beta-lactamase superfamily hydrolase